MMEEGAAGAARMRDTREAGRGGQSPRTAREPVQTKGQKGGVKQGRSNVEWNKCGTLSGICAVEEEGQRGVGQGEVHLRMQDESGIETERAHFEANIAWGQGTHAQGKWQEEVGTLTTAWPSLGFQTNEAWAP